MDIKGIMCVSRTDSSTPTAFVHAPGDILTSSERTLGLCCKAKPCGIMKGGTLFIGVFLYIYIGCTVGVGKGPKQNRIPFPNF